MRCHIDAFAAMSGAPSELLYDRMKTAVIGEDSEGVVSYNSSLVALLNHYGALPRACRPYRAKTKGKSLPRTPFRGRAALPICPAGLLPGPDLPEHGRSQNQHFDRWRLEIANSRVRATTNRVVDAHFAEEKKKPVL